MRSVTKVAAGGGLGSALTIGALFVAGVFTGGAAVVADPVPAPAAAADGLVGFDDCEELLDFYVDRSIDDVGPYGWEAPPVEYFQDGLLGRVESRMPMADNLFRGDFAELSPAAKAPRDAGQGNSETGTNTQEASVDEPDTVKTDGELVVRIVDRNTLVVTDVSGARARELNRVTLPGQKHGAAELLLVGNHVLVIAADPFVAGPGFRDFNRYVAPRSEGVQVYDVDLADPAAPVLADVATYTGQLVAARQYGEVVRLVTETDRPELGWYEPGKGISEDEATRRNQRLVRESAIEDWLPSVTSAGDTEPLLECDQVLRPRHWAGDGTVAVTTFDGADVEDRSAVGVTAAAQLAYSSADRLYLAAAQSPDDEPIEDGDDEPLVLRRAMARTDLHAFALDGTETTYAASGTIAGEVRDRWSLDSADGTLRVAWTRQSSRGKNRNGLITMKEEDGRLVRIGQVRGLGVNEQIQSVRWFDDFAVIVTFRRIDPLYAIDLADPSDPVASGELKVPGYSGYLHPIGDDRLLGLGVDADDRGRTRGAQAATFDVTDLTDPDQLGKLLFGDGTELPALADPRGFTWLPDRRTGITSVSDWRHGGTRLVALRVADDGALTLRDLIEVRGWQVRTLPLDDGRVAVIDVARRDDLRIVDLD